MDLSNDRPEPNRGEELVTILKRPRGEFTRPDANERIRISNSYLYSAKRGAERPSATSSTSSVGRPP